jgi:hypothetical protein
MRLRTLSGSFCALASVALLVTPGLRAAISEQDRSLLVTVLDKEDTAIRDLTAADFFVFEDRVSRTVSGAKLSTEPLAVLLLVDTTKSPIGTPEPTRDVRTAVQTFVKTVFAGGAPTQIAIMDYAGAGTLLRSFTEKVEDVERAATRIVPSQRQNAVLLETLIEAAKEVRKRPAPRRAIVVLDRGSHETSRVLPEKIVDEVSKSGASIWAVSVNSGISAPARDVALDSLTDETGGVRLTAVSPTALEAMMKKVADALVSQYEVTYAGEGSPKSVVPTAKRGAKFLRAPWIR